MSFKLSPYLGAVPNGFVVDDDKPDYLIGRVAAPASRAKGVAPLGDWWCALWAPTGKVVVGVPGTVLMEFVPRRDEIALIRQEGTRKRCDTWFERWSLDGERLSQLLIEPQLVRGGPTAMLFASKDKGRIVEIESADEEGGSFFVALGTGATDRAAATRDELAGKTKP